MLRPWFLNRHFERAPWWHPRQRREEQEQRTRAAQDWIVEQPPEVEQAWEQTPTAVQEPTLAWLINVPTHEELMRRANKIRDKLLADGPLTAEALLELTV